jgi:hypothetical protein
MESSPKFTTYYSILFQCNFATRMKSTNSEILGNFIYILLIWIYKIYRDIVLISDGPVSFWKGGHKSDCYKRKCLLSWANLFFISLYYTGSSPTVSKDVQ